MSLTISYDREIAEHVALKAKAENAPIAVDNQAISDRDDTVFRFLERVVPNVIVENNDALLFQGADCLFGVLSDSIEPVGPVDICEVETLVGKVAQGFGARAFVSDERIAVHGLPVKFEMGLAAEGFGRWPAPKDFLGVEQKHIEGVKLLRQELLDQEFGEVAECHPDLGDNRVFGKLDALNKVVAVSEQPGAFDMRGRQFWVIDHASSLTCQSALVMGARHGVG